MFYAKYFDFHKSRLPKIKYRNTKDIHAINNNHTNKNKIRNITNENETIN